MPWTTFDGTPVLAPAGFNTDPNDNGDILMYPEGDKSAPPSGRMPKDGWFFDSIVRQGPIDDDHLNVEDNLEEFGPISDDILEHFRQEAERLYTQTDKAILASFGGTSFGDIALVPALSIIRVIRKDIGEFDARTRLGHHVGHRVSPFLVMSGLFMASRGVQIAINLDKDESSGIVLLLNDIESGNAGFANAVPGVLD